MAIVGSALKFMTSLALNIWLAILFQTLLHLVEWSLIPRKVALFTVTECRYCTFRGAWTSLQLLWVSQMGRTIDSFPSLEALIAQSCAMTGRLQEAGFSV